MDDLVKIANVVESFATSVAIIVGGVWAYFKFIQGRVFKPKIEVAINGCSYIREEKMHLLHTELSVNNLGLSRVNFDRDSSAMRVSRIIENTNNHADEIGVREVEWHHISTFPVLVEHQWIEPSEIIKEKGVVECNDKVGAIYKIEVYLMTNEVQWYAETIVQIGESEMKDIRNQTTRSEDKAEQLKREKEAQRRKAEEETKKKESKDSYSGSHCAGIQYPQ